MKETFLFIIFINFYNISFSIKNSKVSEKTNSKKLVLALKIVQSDNEIFIKYLLIINDNF